MKIGIFGAHSTGKTTLLEALRNAKPLEGYEFCTEITRHVKELGFPINEDGNDNTQKQIMLQHIYNLTMFDNMITDRTVIDGFVYSQWLFYNKKISRKTLIYVNNITIQMLDEYDLLFYIKPEFDLVDDGVRSSDNNFREEIANIFEDFLRVRELNYTAITGSVEERVGQVLQKIQEMKDDNV